MEQSPLVSILLLSMNHERFIEKCILSLKEQTYKNIEIIYLDNASSDKTFELGKKLLKEAGIAYNTFSNKESKGISKNLNFLLSQSKGAFICPLSSDDWITEDSIKQKVNFLNNAQQYGMVYSSCYFYFNDKRIEKDARERKNLKGGWILKDLLRSNCIIGIGCLIKRNVFEDVGRWDEDSPIEDWDMWIRIAEKFPIGFLNKNLAYYRRNNGKNITGNIQFMRNGFNYILKKYSHYNEIEKAKQYIADIESYHYATYDPNLKSLRIILKNSRMTFFYLKQIMKASFGILKMKLR